VLIELHGITRVAKMVRLMKTMASLGYRLFHVEDNPYCSKCYEVAFIHESLVDPRLARWEPLARRKGWPLAPGEREYCRSVLGAQVRGALSAQHKRRAQRVGDPLGLKGLKWQGALSRLLIPEYSCPDALRLGKWGLGASGYAAGRSRARQQHPPAVAQSRPAPRGRRRGWGWCWVAVGGGVWL